MSIAALFGVIWHFSKDEFIPYLKEKAVPFLKKHWKQIIAFILLCWTIMCLLTHCSGVIDPWGHHSTNDTIRTVDTVMVYPDTAAIFALHGFDTLPKYVRHIENRLRFKPAPPVFSVDASCRDSLVVMRSHSELLTEILSDCDSAYGDAVAVRSYGDTLRNDSIEITLNLRVEGRLRGTPSIRYRHLAPYPVITITETVIQPPKKGIYVEGGLGTTLDWNNNLNTISGSAGIGYTTRSGWSFGPRGTFNQNFYTVEGTVRKTFSIGK
jgi:hypothetical protein